MQLTPAQGVPAAARIASHRDGAGGSEEASSEAIASVALEQQLFQRERPVPSTTFLPSACTWLGPRSGSPATIGSDVNGFFDLLPKS